MSKRTPTQQQLNVIAAVIDPLIRFLKIMAAAGSGKTTVLMMSAEASDEQNDPGVP